MRQTMYHKARDTLRQAKVKRMVSAKLLWKDFTEMTNTASLCLKKDGQKNESDNMTHLHRKTIPVKLHLEKGDDGRRTGTFFQKKKRTP